jgi:hypothetical protein
LQQVLDPFVAEARQILEPKDRHLLDLHLSLFVLSGGAIAHASQAAGARPDPAARAARRLGLDRAVAAPE